MTGRLIPFERPASRGGAPTEAAVYTVEEVAFLLHVARSTAYELVRDGVIPAQRLGRRWIVPRTRFHAWLDGQGPEPRPAAGR